MLNTPTTEEVKASTQPSNIISFETINLPPGAIMQMQFIHGNLQERHDVRYVGIINKQSMLVTLPIVDGTSLWMQIKQRNIFRGFNGRFAYAFTSQVIRARTHPFPYVHFTYPENIEYRQVRHSMRIPISLAGIVTTQHNNIAIPVNLHDLSAEGAMLATTEHLGKIGDEVQLSLTLSVDDHQVNLKIASCIRSITAGQLGLEFKSVSNNDSLILHYVISNNMQRIWH